MHCLESLRWDPVIPNRSVYPFLKLTIHLLYIMYLQVEDEDNEDDGESIVSEVEEQPSDTTSPYNIASK